MLKRIALTVVFVVTAAVGGVSVARAQSGAKAKTIELTPKAPQGWPCSGGGCFAEMSVVRPAPQGFKCSGGGCTL